MPLRFEEVRVLVVEDEVRMAARIRRGLFSVRRKIDRPFGLDQLETVRGAGYRLRTRPGAATAAGTAGTGRRG